MKLRCGLLGEKLGHSYSPALHAQFGDYGYRLFERAPEELDAFFSSDCFDAVNVTMPYKKAAAAYCAELGADARAAGCVNTVVRRGDGTLFGENTDVAGFVALLRRSGIEAKGQKALVLGSGGASAAVRVALERAGVRETVTVSRHGENTYQDLSRHRDAGLIVNATPVGMYPQNGASPLDLRAFPRLVGVLDVIYNPARTALLQQAEELGVRSCGGLYMLAAQAKRASELFTGTAVKEETLERAARMLAMQTEDLILVGMPGSGKTTLAGLLGAMTGRAVFDCDALICEAAGMSVPELFAREGEDGFRKRETQALRELGKRSGCIIATGGGCVTREENRALLRQNGRVLWVRRAPELLATEARPLSQRGSLAELYEKRRPLYEHFADAWIDNDGAPEDAAKRAWACFTALF